MLMMQPTIHNGQLSILFTQPRPIRSCDNLTSFDSSESEASDDDHYGFKPKQSPSDQFIRDWKETDLIPIVNQIESKLKKPEIDLHKQEIGQDLAITEFLNFSKSIIEWSTPQYN